MRSSQDNWTRKKLEQLADAIWKRPALFVWPQVLLAVFCLFYAVNHLKFSGTRADLVSDDVKYQRDFQAYKREFEQPDALVAVVESESLEKNRRFVERLASRIEQEAKLFANTYYKGDLGMMGKKGLLFLSEETLAELKTVLEKEWPFIETHTKANSLNSVIQMVNREFRESDSTKLDVERLARAFPVVRKTLEEAAQGISTPLAHSFPGLGALFGDQTKLYLNFGEGRIYAVVTHAVSPEVEKKSVERLRELVSETSQEVPGVNAGISGEPVLNYDEMNQAQWDVNIATLYSIGIVALIFIYGFHETRRPLLATLCLAFGVTYSLGFTAMTVGHLNLLTITMVPILIGLAIDFGVHLISRYEEALKRGEPAQAALREALPRTGVGILTSAFTVSGAFLAMMLTDFKGIQEMGFVSGMGLLLCLVPMITLLPALLACEKSRDKTYADYPRHARARRFLEQLWLRHPKFVVGGAVVLTLLSATQFSRLRFDYNLLNLQSAQLPAVGIEKKLIQSGSQSFLYGVVVANSLEEAAEMQTKIEKLDLVKKVNSMVPLLTENQEKKLQLIRAIKAMAEQLDLAPLNSSPVNIGELNESLFALEGYLGLALEELREKAEAVSLLPELERVREEVIRLRSLTVTENAEVITRLMEFEKILFRTVRETVQIMKTQDTSGPLTVNDLPPFLRERYVSPSGKFLLEVHPKTDLWQRANQEPFLRSLRAVVPDVTGTLVQIYEYTSLIRKNFVKATAYAAAIVALVLLIEFRRLGAVFLALVPVALGLCWMAGLMGAWGIMFNPVNIMSLTLLIGIGVGNGIHILERFAEDPHPAILSKSTGKAVLVSAFTTMAGFGSLMVAKHRGIASLGELMFLGTATCLIASLGLLPAIMTLMNKREKQAPNKI